jgi:hypothetical protein
MAKIGSHEISSWRNQGTSFVCGRAVMFTFF